MKLIIVLLAIACIVLSANAQADTVPRVFLDNFATRATIDGVVGGRASGFYNHSGAAGQLVYGEVIDKKVGGSEIESAIDVVRSGRLVFSIPTGAESNFFLVWAATATPTWNCPSPQSMQTGCTAPPVTGTGLNLDISNYDALAFLLQEKDLTEQISVTLRMWFNDGTTQAVTVTQEGSVVNEAAQKPALIFFLNDFGGSHLTSTLRAVAFGLDAADNSLDLAFSPFQFLGSLFNKTTTTQSISPNDGSLTYEANVFFSNYESTVPFDANTSFIRSVTFTDTLDSEFLPASNVQVTLIDFNGVQTTLPVVPTFNGNQFSFVATRVGPNVVQMRVTYETSVGGTSTSCQATLCNNAQVQINTFQAGSVQPDSTRNRQDQVCLPFTSTPDLALTVSTCPQFSANPVVEYVLANNGAGPALNTVMNQTTFAGECVVTSITADGNALSFTQSGAFVVATVGTVPAQTSANVRVEYDCSAVADACGQFTYNTVAVVDDDCGQVPVQQTCTFSTTGTNVLGVTSQSCPAFSANPQKVYDLTNTGSVTATNVVLTQSNFPGQCVVTQLSVGGVTLAPTATPNDVYTVTVPSVGAGETVSVVVDYDCSAVDQSCGSPSFPLVLTADNDCNQVPATDNTCTINYVGQVQLVLDTQCPAAFEQNPVVTSTLTNNGNAVAANVNISKVFTSQDSCTLQSVTLNGNPANTNLDLLNVGSIGPGQSVAVVATYDCSAFLTLCGTSSFAMNIVANDDCAGDQQTQVCQFSNTLTATLEVSETASTQEARIGDSVTFTVTAVNRGPAVPEVTMLTKTYGPDVTPDTATLNMWNCDVNTRSCSMNFENLAVDSPQVRPFVVVVDNTFSPGVNETCNNVQFASMQPADCAAPVTTAACAPVNAGAPAIALQKAAYSSEYTYTITYTSEGTAPVSNLVLYEDLQAGWTLSPNAPAGWVCSSTSCQYAVAEPVAPGATFTVDFVVDVQQEYQENNERCWSNQVSTSFSDSQFDPNLNNNVAEATIGSKCTACCEPSCPPDVISEVRDCPTQFECLYDFPEYHCPPCKVDPQPCSCNECSNAAAVLFGQ